MIVKVEHGHLRLTPETDQDQKLLTRLDEKFVIAGSEWDDRTDPKTYSYVLLELHRLPENEP